MRDRVPLLDLEAQHRPLRRELIEAVTRVLDSQRFILGEEVEAFEREVADLLGVKHAIGVSSGTDALLVSLMALGIGAGDEVITSTYSFFATAGSIARLGARPVFVDIDAATCNLAAERVEGALSPRTRAILPAHLYGHPVEFDAIARIGDRAGVPVVEDACQAIGATYRGRAVGGLGVLGCFSFYPTKNLGAAGDGGLVAANDDALAEHVRLLRHHGAGADYSHRLVGGNFRLDAIQAAVLRVKVPHLGRWTEARRRIAERYSSLACKAGLPEHGIALPIEVPGCHHAYHQYVIRASCRDELRADLGSRGVGTAVYYPTPLHLQQCFRELGYRPGDFPNAEAAARETLALPMYPGLTAEQQEYVIASIAEFYRDR